MDLYIWKLSPVSQVVGAGLYRKRGTVLFPSWQARGIKHGAGSNGPICRLMFTGNYLHIHGLSRYHLIRTLCYLR